MNLLRETMIVYGGQKVSRKETGGKDHLLQGIKLVRGRAIEVVHHGINSGGRPAKMTGKFSATEDLSDTWKNGIVFEGMKEAGLGGMTGNIDKIVGNKDIPPDQRPMDVRRNSPEPWLVSRGSSWWWIQKRETVHAFT